VGTRKRYSPREKLSVVLEGLRGESSITEICRRHDVSQNLYYKWKEQFLRGGIEIFENQGKTAKSKAYQDKVKELERIIGRQVIELEILKKTQEYF
jgi:transposase